MSMSVSADRIFFSFFFSLFTSGRVCGSTSGQSECCLQPEVQFARTRVLIWQPQPRDQTTFLVLTEPQGRGTRLTFASCAASQRPTIIPDAGRSSEAAKTVANYSPNHLHPHQLNYLMTSKGLPCSKLVQSQTTKQCLYCDGRDGNDGPPPTCGLLLQKSLKKKKT